MDPEMRRFISIVVVAMLLLAGLMTALTLLPHPGGDDGDKSDQGWRVEDDMILVYSDATWSNWDTVLEHPVQIEWGCTLTIEDSYLEVPLERMVFDEFQQFTIMDDASLVMKNSTLVVDEDPQLETAMFDAYGDGGIPILWRVVNLIDAENPMLEMELELIEGEPRVVVAYQRMPRDPLEILTVIEPEDLVALEWVPIRVSLEELVGGTPRVLVFVHNQTVAELMVADVTVTDGNGDLPGDAFSLGDLDDDGWRTEELYSFTQMLRNGNFYVNPLIGGYGDLHVIDSRIQSVPGLQRWEENYRPQARLSNGSVSSVTVWTAPNEGGINVSGNLEFISSEVAYVPIETEGITATFQDCSFVGDCQMLSISKAEATVQDCDFEYRTEEGSLGTNRVDEDTWMLSLDRSIHDPLVKGCTFTGEGHGVGLVVNQQRVDMIDVTFSGLQIGVWVHGAGPPMQWGSVGSSISYDETCTIGYLETTEVRVEFEGENMPNNRRDDYDYWTSEELEEVPGLDEIYFPVLATGFYSLFCLPVMVVGPTMGVYPVETVDVWVNPQWANGKMLTVDPSQYFHHVLFERPEDDPSNSWQMVFDHQLAPGGSPGVLVTRLWTYNEMFAESDAYVNITIDDEQIDHVVLNATEYNWSDYSVQWVTLPTIVPPGPHVINYTCGISSSLWNITFESLPLSLPVYRATSDDDDDDLERWLHDNPSSTVLVDPGVTLTDMAYVDNVSEEFELAFMTWKGSEVSFEEMVFSPNGWGRLVNEGNGSFEIQRLSGNYLWHYVGNCTVTIGTMDCMYYIPRLYNGELVFNGDMHGSEYYFEIKNGSSIRMDGVDFEQNTYLEVVVIGSEWSMTDCTVTSPWYGGVFISSLDGATCSFESCEFVNSSMKVDLYDMNDTLYIRNCTFGGAGATLSISGDETVWEDPIKRGMAIPVSGSVSGNLFRGQGAGMVFDPLLRDTILGGNRFEEGAKAYAIYYPVVEGEQWTFPDIGFITMDSIAYHRSNSISWSEASKYHDHLVDVTDDFLGDTDPGQVPVIIRIQYSSHSGPRGAVVGFQYLPISADAVTLRDCIWGRVESYVWELETRLDAEDNWWTG